MTSARCSDANEMVEKKFLTAKKRHFYVVKLPKLDERKKRFLACEKKIKIDRNKREMNFTILRQQQKRTKRRIKKVQQALLFMNENAYEKERKNKNECD